MIVATVPGERMTKTTRLVITSLLGFAISATAFTVTATADPERRREERRGERREQRPGDQRRVERHENRRGYVCVCGYYEWRGGAYVWTPGRYEAERRGYRWREPRWEVRDGVYVRTDGGWIVDGPGMAPPVVREA